MNYRTTSFKMLLRVLFAAFFIVVAAPLLFAQKAEKARKQFAKMITKDELKEHLSILASDEYAGRETGKEGQKKAAKYISKKFKSFGLQGPFPKNKGLEKYQQNFPLRLEGWEEMMLKGKSGGKLEYLKDFYYYGSFLSEKEEPEFIFAGYGLDTKTYSDFKRVDVSGKIAVVLMGSPWDKGDDEKQKAMNNIKAESAQKYGAKGICFVYEENTMLDNFLLFYGSYFAKPRMTLLGKENKPFPQIFTSPGRLGPLVGMSEEDLKKIKKKIRKKKKPLYSKKLSRKFKIEGKTLTKDISTENVLGFLPGTTHKDEIIVVSSHYDHIGTEDDGKVNNGADDDGSGTVAVLEIAEAFAAAAKSKDAPKRSILFMTFTGEEKGLLGSEYYADYDPVYPLKNTVANFNIDMIGRVDARHEDKSDYLYLIGSDMLSTELHNQSEKVRERYFPKFEFDYKYNSKDDPNNFYERSDHYNFAKNNIPVIFYFNGTHEDYHQPTDEVKKINFDVLRTRARVIFHTIWEIANADKKPKVDKAGND